MKKFLSVIVAAIALIVTSGCNKSDDYKPIYLSFVNVEKNVSARGGYTFSTDSDIKLSLAEDPGVVLKFDEGQRVLIYFNIIEDNKKSCTIKLLGYDDDIALGSTDLVSTKEEAEEYGTTPTSFQTSPNAPNATNRYINLYIGFVGEKPSSHDFTLLHIESEDPVSDKYLELRVMHDDNADKGEKEYWGWISFPVDPIKGLILGNEAYKINIKTRLNGDQAVMLAIPSNTTSDFVAE